MKFTESTPTSIGEIKNELDRIKKRGYALDDHDYIKGIGCIAAPIFDANRNAFASFGVSVPYERYVENKDEYIEKVCAAAKKASQYLGYYAG